MIIGAFSAREGINGSTKTEGLIDGGVVGDRQTDAVKVVRCPENVSSGNVITTIVIHKRGVCDGHH